MHTIETAAVRATEDANCWRGWMVNQFARAERLIVEALMRREPGMKAPTVLKQRVDRLRPQVGKQAVSALDRFLRLSGNRNAIAHGDGLIAIDRKGQWVLRLTYYDRDGRTETTLHQPEAEALRSELRAAISELSSALKA